jgi:hypothetical protein
MKTKLLLLSFIGLIVFACRPIYATYTLINSTGNNLEIYGYRMGDGHISFAAADPIYMEPFSELEFKRGAGEDYETETFFSVPYVDSVEIIFDEEKKLVLSRHIYPCPDCHSILQGFFEATITEEDYNNAAPIEE